MRRKFSTLFLIVLIASLIIVTRWTLFRLPTCQPRPASRTLDSTLFATQAWKMPEWVRRYNVSHLFDWTWHKNGDFERCRKPFVKPPPSSACTVDSPVVVNDVLAYFHLHPDEGCIVDNIARLPNLTPHPLPHARSLSDTCSSLHIDRQWVLCHKLQAELDRWLPSTSRFVVFAVFNAHVDTGSCHPSVPGTVFTERATFHPQRWTGNRCYNDSFRRIPSVEPYHQHAELIDTLGNYLQAPGHFGPQQLPRLLRLLATVPSTAKVLVAKGGIADALMDVLVERGVVTRERIVPFDDDTNPNHFAHIVYRSDAWPYLSDPDNAHYIHDRTDMQLVHRVLASDEQQTPSRKDLVVLIKREEGRSRSIVEHTALAAFMASALNSSKLSSGLRLAIFEAHGHVREHIALFRRARVIVGPHGAGMMNVLWASPGTHVVEIGYTKGMTLPEMYAEMSLHLEQHYWICKGRGDYAGPMHVDMDDFTYIFRQILQQVEVESQRT